MRLNSRIELYDLTIVDIKFSTLFKPNCNGIIVVNSFESPLCVL